jgi:hypothetical protein
MQLGIPGLTPNGLSHTAASVAIASEPGAHHTDVRLRRPFAGPDLVIPCSRSIPVVGGGHSDDRLRETLAVC